jgi:exonuclease III
MAARDVTHAEIITPANSPVGDLALMRLDGLNVLGCYFPQSMAKSPFFDRCAETAQRQSSQPFLMIGDFNTGRNDLDVEGDGTPFDCADQFKHLSERVGLTDLWRFRHGDRREWSWRSAKNGFRIDHAFANRAFLDRYPNYQCQFNHEPRLTGLTDHSAIVLDLHV